MAEQDDSWLLEPARTALPLNEPLSVCERLETVARLLAEESAPVAAGPRLIWRDTNDAVRSHPLTETSLIGRDAACQIPFDDPHVSHHHCRIFRDACGLWRIEDLGSRNGTRVNGRPVARAHLREGDILEVGRVEVVFLG